MRALAIAWACGSSGRGTTTGSLYCRGVFRVFAIALKLLETNSIVIRRSMSLYIRSADARDALGGTLGGASLGVIGIVHDRVHDRPGRIVCRFLHQHRQL